MILRFRHRGLKKLFEHDDPRGLPRPYIEKIQRVLLALDTVSEPAALDLPGFGLHRLSGDLAGFWSITVSRNWRIVFQFEGENTAEVDFLDYH